MVTLGFMLLWCSIVFASTIPKDIVLMIDNSGSMKKNDPDFLTKNAVSEFVSKLSDDIRFAVLIFDHRVNLVLSLTTVSEASREDILASFDNLDFKGRLTNIPAAMERAIYELKTKGRKESQKSIIFITDGIIDTGNKNRDIDKARWLRDNLSEDAAEHGIKIFGVAFTDHADFELIQFLAQKTKGKYFRAFTPEDIVNVFSEINQAIVSTEPAVGDRPISVETSRSTEAPAPTPAPLQLKKLISPKTIPGVLVALGVIILVIVFWTRRKKPGITPPPGRPHVSYTTESVPEAALKDMSGVTGQDVFEINERMTKIGRLSGSQEDPVNHIVIDRKTISRKHAVIEYKNHSFWIMDMDSANGTFLNNRRVTNEMQLKHGDTISFDTFNFNFVTQEMAQAELDGSGKTICRPEGDSTIVCSKAELEKSE